MKCGCVATGTDSNNKPVCVTHIGLQPWATEVQDEKPDLTGRIAHCGYGKHAPKPSSYDLPFFKYRPTHDFDEYYCGCFGWD
jgi:hypothetical protein